MMQVIEAAQMANTAASAMLKQILLKSLVDLSAQQNVWIQYHQ